MKHGARPMGVVRKALLPNIQARGRIVGPTKGSWRSGLRYRGGVRDMPTPGSSPCNAFSNFFVNGTADKIGLIAHRVASTTGTAADSDKR